MEKISKWFKNFFTVKNFQIIFIKFIIYTVIYFILLHFMFKIFWDESLADVIFK